MYKKLSISFFSCELQMLHLYLFSFFGEQWCLRRARFYR